MQFHRLKVDKTGLELGARVPPDFPVSGGRSSTDLAGYEGGRFEYHFHAEAEFTLINEGEMYYRANDKVMLLQKGDAVFVNGEVMHAGWLTDKKHCLYQTINLSVPAFFGGEDTRIRQKFVDPLNHENLIPFAAFFAKNEADAPLLEPLYTLFLLQLKREEGYELLCSSELYRFWYLLYRRAATWEPVEPDRGVGGVKETIAFMEAHYAERLTLEQLAAVCRFSRSEFCRIFKRYTGRTPFAYLRHLRVRRSLPLLRDPSLSVTEVAERTGFAGASYYAEVFRRYMNTSPLAYRRKNLSQSLEKP